MTSIDLLRCGTARSFRGSLHCHSNRSDGFCAPEVVAAAYRAAGYDFIVLSDHFEAAYGWQVSDTRQLHTADFTTIIGAELSSGAWTERETYWVVAAGLPLDFAAPTPDNHAEAILRAAECGAFVVLLHPGLNNLSQAAVAEMPGLAAIHAVEIYTHTTALATSDRAYGGYMLDGLLECGHHLLACAGDDAHFSHPRDRFGGWVEVYAEHLEPQSLLAALKAGHYFSTQGPKLYELVLDGTQLRVETSAAYAITVAGSGAQWLNTDIRTGSDDALLSAATFDLTPFQGAYCRVTVVDNTGRSAWSNPIWP